MDVTGLRVSVDATPAESGRDKFNNAMTSMGTAAKTVSAQVKASVDDMTGSVSSGANTVSSQMDKMASSVASGAASMGTSFGTTAAAIAALEDAMADAGSGADALVSSSRALVLAQAEASDAASSHTAAVKALRDSYVSLGPILESNAAAQAFVVEAEMTATASSERLALAKKMVADASALQKAALAEEVVVTEEGTLSLAGYALAADDAAASTGKAAGGTRVFTAAMGLAEGRMQSGNIIAARFLQSIAALGPIMEAAFEVIGPIILISLLIQGVEWINKQIDAYHNLAATTEESFRAQTSAMELSNDQLSVGNDRLQAQLDKLEKKPHNGLQDLLDDAKLSADELGSSLEKDIASTDKLVQSSKTGFLAQVMGMASSKNVDNMIMGNGTGPTPGGYQGLIQDTERRNTQEIDSATQHGGSPESINNMRTQELTDLESVFKTVVDGVTKDLQTRQNAQSDKAGQALGLYSGDLVGDQSNNTAKDQAYLKTLADEQASIGAQYLKSNITQAIEPLRTALKPDPHVAELASALEKLDTKALFSGQLANAALIGPGAVSDVKASQSAALMIQSLRPKGLTGDFDVNNPSAATGQAKQVVDKMNTDAQNEQLQKQNAFYQQNSAEIEYNTETQKGLLAVIGQGPAAVEEYIRSRQEMNAVEKEGEGLTGAAAEAFKVHAAALEADAKAQADATIAAQRAQAVENQRRSIGLESTASTSLISAQKVSGQAASDSTVTSQVNQFAQQNKIAMNSDEYKSILALTLAQSHLAEVQQTAASVISAQDPFRAYTDDMSKLTDALNKGAISWIQYQYAAQDATDAVAKAEENMLMKTKTAQGGIEAALIEIGQDSTNMATSTNKAVMDTYNNLNTDLTKLIDTGHAKFGNVVSSAEGDITSGIIKSMVTGPAMQALGGAFGLSPGTLGGKPDGSSGNPLWVRMATAGATGGLPIPLGTGTTMATNPIGTGVTSLLGFLGLGKKKTAAALPTSAGDDLIGDSTGDDSGGSALPGGIFGGSDPLDQAPDGSNDDPFYVTLVNSSGIPLDQVAGSEGSSGGGFLSAFEGMLGMGGGAGASSGLEGDSVDDSELVGAANGGIIVQGFANGGITRKPTLFATSEFNHSEAVVPLPDGNTIPVRMSGQQQQSSGQNIQVKMVDGTANKVTAKAQQPKWDEKLQAMVVQVYLADSQNNGKMSQLRQSERSSSTS